MVAEVVAVAVVVDATLVANKGIWQGTVPQEEVVGAAAAVVSLDLVEAAAAAALGLVAGVVTATIVENLDTLLENAQPMLDQ